jgi:hypothetical protein
MDKRICKSCKIIKDRVPDGTFKSPKNKKWRDESGLLWNGSVCGICNQVRLKEHMKSKRSKPDEVL